MIIQQIFYKKTFRLGIKLALFITCIGVMIVSLTDASLNAIGTIYALTGVLAASLYQIWVGTKQEDLQMNSFQLLYYQAPISGLILLAIFPFLDDMTLLREYVVTQSALLAIGSSCILAFLVNLSTFMLIGSTSVM